MRHIGVLLFLLISITSYAADIDTARQSIRQAHALAKAKQYNEAITAYDAVIEKFMSSTSLPIQRLIAQTMLDKSQVYEQQENHIMQNASYNSVIQTFGNTKDPLLQRLVVQAMYDKAARVKGNWRDAAEFYADLVNEFRTNSQPEIRLLVAQGMYGKAKALAGQAAVSAYDDLIHTFSGTSNPTIRMLVAQAFADKITYQGNRADAIATIDLMFKQFGDSDIAEIQRLTARATYRRIALSKQQKQSTITAYQQFISKYGSSKQQDIQTLARRAMYEQVTYLIQQKDLAGAINAYDTFAARTLNHQEMQVANALDIIGQYAQHVNDDTAALNAYNTLINQFSSSSDRTILNYVARAMNAKGIILDRAGRPAEAIAAYDNLIQLFGPKQESFRVAPFIVPAMYNKALTLGAQGRVEEQLVVLDALITRYANQTDVQSIVESAERERKKIYASQPDLARGRF